MGQNQQFEDVMRGLTYAKECLDPARYVVHMHAAFGEYEETYLCGHLYPATDFGITTC